MKPNELIAMLQKMPSDLDVCVVTSKNEHIYDLHCGWTHISGDENYFEISIPATRADKHLRKYEHCGNCGHSITAVFGSKELDTDEPVRGCDSIGECDWKPREKIENE